MKSLKSISLVFSFFLILVIPCELKGQNRFSKDFTHNVDEMNLSCELKYEDLCKTTFIREAVEVLIGVDSISYLKVGHIRVEEKPYFVLYAKNEKDSTLSFTIGSYPCPVDCVPPDPITPIFSKIDLADINSILNYSANVSYISVRVGRLKNQDSTFSPAFILYGATGRYNPKDPNSVDDLKEAGYPVYISTE